MTGRRSCRPPRPPRRIVAYSGVFGHTFLVSNNTVNGFRVTVNRGAHTKEYVPLLDYTDLGIKATPVLPELLALERVGRLSRSTNGLPTATPTWVYQVADDLSILRGEHQFGIGANYIYSRYDPESYTSAAGNTTFTGGVTGLGLADYMLGERTRGRPARRRVRRCDPTTSGCTSRTTGACLRT